MAHITACSPSPLQNFDLDLTKLDLGKSVPAVFQRGVPVPWTPRAARALPDTYERGPQPKVMIMNPPTVQEDEEEDEGENENEEVEEFCEVPITTSFVQEDQSDNNDSCSTSERDIQHGWSGDKWCDRHQNVATHTFISLEMKGVKLDGKEGLPEEVRQNFGSAVQHLKIHKDDLVIKAQTFMFLIHNVSDQETFSDQESSKIKAMNAGVISVVRND